MAMIDGPLSGISIPRQLGSGGERIQKQIARIASGRRINQASDGPAELAVSQRLRSQIGALGIKIQGAQNFISKGQVVEGSLGQIGDIAQRVKELSTQAATGTLTSGDRQNIQVEVSQLREEINRIAKGASFNRHPVDVNLDLTSLEEVNVETQTGAQSSINKVGEFIDSVSSRRAQVGAETRGLESRVRNLSSERVNLISAESRIRDADIGEAITELKTNQLRQQVGVSILSDVLRSGSVVDLLG